MGAAESWTTLAVLDWTTQRFTAKGIPSARLDAQLLLAFALRCTRVQLYTQFDKPLAPAELTLFRDLVRRRLADEPVAYLLGEQEFWSLALAVSPDVLIPRRDTETLIEAVVPIIRAAAWPELRILDVGTGSGAIALALAREFPEAHVWAGDVSPAAVAIAQQNVARHGCAERVEVTVADLLTTVVQPAHVIVSNPPYIASADIATLAPDVQREPRLALDGGPTGLAIIARLITQAEALLVSGGVLALEHGFDQAPHVQALMPAPMWADVRTVRDLGGHDRVTLARRT